MVTRFSEHEGAGRQALTLGASQAKLLIGTDCVQLFVCEPLVRSEAPEQGYAKKTNLHVDSCVILRTTPRRHAPHHSADQNIRAV